MKSTSFVLFPSASLLLAILLLLSGSPLFAMESAPPFGTNIQVRGGLGNSRLQFERQKKGNVAFIGGSITEMNGFRPLVCDILKKRFPDTAFTFTNAGMASTCSTTGAFRLDRDVLKQGPVDLLFVEFAVNDDVDAHYTRQECIRGMEGIIRHARQQNPNIDIVMTYFADEDFIQTLQTGKTPLTIEAHEAVASRYAVPSVNVAKELTEEIAAGTNSWKEYGSIHPGPEGSAFCAKMLGELLDRAWAAPLSEKAALVARPLPLPPLDPFSYSKGRFIDPSQVTIKNGWSLEIPDWQNLPGQKRERYTSIPMLCATQPGATTSLEFEGTTIGAFIVAGPDAGIVEASVDGEPFRPVDLYHFYSKALHYPCTVILGTNLKPGKHQLTLRISGKTKSEGQAMRIMQFCVN